MNKDNSQDSELLSSAAASEASIQLSSKQSSLTAPNYALNTGSDMEIQESGDTRQLMGANERGGAITPPPYNNASGSGQALPEDLQAGIEGFSGLSMGDVQVHYNSPFPHEFDAHAFAQGNDIHLASGQEQHLPHEAWHVVQQKQGRVPETTQLKGKSVNDDSSLEREADIMGKKALQLKEKGQTPLSTGVSSTKQTVQFEKRKKSIGEKSRKKGTSGRLSIKPAISKGPKEKGSQIPYMFFIRSEKGIYDKINAYYNLVKPTIDDDHDVSLLEEFQTDAAFQYHQIIRNAKKLAGFGQQRSNRRNPKYQATQTYAAVLRRGLLKILAEFKATFPLHSGGFGAKGRAHADEKMGTSEVRTHDGQAEDRSFLSNIDVGEGALTDAVYKDQLKVPSEASSTPKVDGRDQGQLTPGRRTELLTDLERHLTKKPQNSEQSFTNTPVGMDRGDGQYKNMGNTNASGYAMLAGIPGWETQRWEWLHIRGASLGGATDGSNLVVGTRDANTHMIPFESNIRTLATEVHNNINYSSLDVKWSKSSPYNGLAQHAFNQLKIEWTLKKNADHRSEAEDISGSALFKPLATGSNISKKEVEILESALKNVRDGLVTT